MPKNNASSQPESPDFETALEQLQAIINRMENDQQSLEAAIADYEQGTRLAALCQQLLDTAQLKIEQLVKTSEGEKFEPVDSADV